MLLFCLQFSIICDEVYINVALSELILAVIKSR